MSSMARNRAFRMLMWGSLGWMQIQQASKAGQKVSIIDTFKAEYKLGGFNRVAGFATNVGLDD